MKLTKDERNSEKALMKGEYVRVSPEEYKSVVDAINRKRKQAILNIRINKDDLASLKKKAKRYKVPYQTFISELLHRFAA